MSAIDYDLSQLRGVAFDVDGVLSPSTMAIAADGSFQRMFNVKDLYAMQQAISRGLKIAIISDAECHDIVPVLRAVGITDIYIGIDDKLLMLEQWTNQYHLTSKEIAFVGDDLPDLMSMRFAGLSVAPADAAIDLRYVAHYISPANGGYGVARDLLEQILRAQRNWR